MKSLPWYWQLAAVAVEVFALAVVRAELRGWGRA